MADKCLAQIKVCRMRVCRLDTNGVPTPGSETMYVSKAMSRVTVRGVYTDGDEFKEKNGCGEQMVSLRGPDNFDRIDVEVEVITHDPFLLEMLTPGSAVLDADVNRPGYAAPALGTVATDAISLELWAQRLNAAGTGLDPDYPYAWWVLPWVQNMRLGDKEFANATSKPVVSGQGYENLNWYDGPLNDWPESSDRVYQWVPWTTMPTESCGYAAIAAS